MLNVQTTLDSSPTKRRKHSFLFFLSSFSFPIEFMDVWNNNCGAPSIQCSLTEVIVAHIFLYPLLLQVLRML